MTEREVFELIDRFKTADKLFHETIDCLNKLKFYRKQYEHYSDRARCESGSVNINDCKINMLIRYVQKPIGFYIAGKELSYNQMCKLIGNQKRKVRTSNSYRDIAFREMKIAVETRMSALSAEDGKRRTFDEEIALIYDKFYRISVHEQEIKRLKKALELQEEMLATAKEKLDKNAE